MRERLTRLLGMEVAGLTRVRSAGYTVAFHGIAELASGRTAFVKAATEPVTAEFIRDEQRVFRALEGPFMPALLALDEDEPPLLVLEDLRARTGRRPGSRGRSRRSARRSHGWPTPHRPARFLRSASIGTSWSLGWAEIEADPAPFLALALCSERWLADALSVLREASETAPIDGEAVLHLDVRSDNLCIAERGAVLVDWNHACVGTPTSTSPAGCRRSGSSVGPNRRRSFPERAGSRRCSQASSAAERSAGPADRTHGAEFQLAQLRVALPWAARELDLPSPG